MFKFTYKIKIPKNLSTFLKIKNTSKTIPIQLKNNIAENYIPSSKA